MGSNGELPLVGAFALFVAGHDSNVFGWKMEWVVHYQDILQHHDAGDVIHSAHSQKAAAV